MLSGSAYRTLCVSISSKAVAGVHPLKPASEVVSQKPFAPTATLVGFCTIADLSNECELVCASRIAIPEAPMTIKCEPSLSIR